MFVSCSKGVEEIVADELQNFIGDCEISYVTGRVFFSVTSAVNDDEILLAHRLCAQLRSPERLFVQVGRMEPILLPSYKKIGFAKFTRALESLEESAWLSALRLFNMLRMRKQCPGVEHADNDAVCLTRFRVSLKLRGINQRKYCVEELSALAAKTISSMLGWMHDPRMHQVEILIHISDSQFVIGIPCQEGSLAQRPRGAVPGLRFNTAYCMVHVAAIREGDVVLDPMCGHGTLLMEASCIASAAVLVGCDRCPDAVAQATQNMSIVGATRASIMQCLGQHLPLRNHSIDVIVCDMPFNHAHVLDTSIDALLTEWIRVLRPGGRMVLLTKAEALVTSALDKWGFTSEVLPIRLGTMDACVVITGVMWQRMVSRGSGHKLSVNYAE